MAPDICYLEKSAFRSESVVSRFPGYEWKLASDERSFLKDVIESPPLLLIVGDTGSANAVELLFCIRSLRGYNRIPVLLYGEHEFSRILPASGVVPNTPDGLDALGERLERLTGLGRRRLGTERGGWAAPAGFSEAGFIGKRARSLLREELFKKYIYSEITGMDIADLDFGDFLKKLNARIAELLFADFVFTTSPFNGKNYGRLHLGGHPGDGNIKRIKTSCLKALPPETAAEVSAGLQISFRRIMDQPPSISEPLILLNEPLSPADEHGGRIVAGCFIGTGEGASSVPSSLTAEAASVVVSRAAACCGMANENRLIYRAFSRFLPAPIIDDLLLKESEKALLTGEKRRIVVLFSHIRQFDRIVEHNEPQRVVEFLNSHFTNVVGIIQDHGGSIDKFIGDAVFAIFGAPISYLDNSRRAADAALEMMARYGDISLSGLSLPEDGFSIGVGLNEGEAIIGNIGCADKFDYTAIGDTVNLAARLESLTKHYRQDILISRVVYRQIYRDYFCRLIDRARVKGKNEATEIYSLTVEPDLYTDGWRRIYSKGFRMYSLGNWYTAAGYLSECLELMPDDEVCRILLERCNSFLAEPPPDWDGAVALDFK